MNKKQEKIGDVVFEVLNELKEKNQETQTLLRKAWEEVLTIQENEKMEITGFKDKCLYVKVIHPAWLYEILGHRQKDILAKMQQRVGEDALINIKYSV